MPANYDSVSFTARLPPIPTITAKGLEVMAMIQKSRIRKDVYGDPDRTEIEKVRGLGKGFQDCALMPAP